MAATNRLIAAGREFPLDAIAAKASWGWLSRRAIPNPSSTLFIIVQTFWPEEVIANNPLQSFISLSENWK
jgi:hypothetical protein